MNNVKQIEIETANKLVSYRIAWLLKDLGFNWPVLKAVNARDEEKTSDGTYFFRNRYTEASRPTYGLAVIFLKDVFDFYVSLYVGEGVGKFEKWEKTLQENLEKMVKTYKAKNKKDINKVSIKDIKKDFLKDALWHKNNLLKELKESEELLNVLGKRIGKAPTLKTKKKTIKK